MPDTRYNTPNSGREDMCQVKTISAEICQEKLFIAQFSIRVKSFLMNLNHW